MRSPGCAGTRKLKNRKGEEINDGFEGWGGYMAAKRAKLIDQFHKDNVEKISDIFAGIKIMVNGLTHPSASELKYLMAQHGGEFHMYQVSSTTHIIASNLPNVKVKHLGAVPIVKPAWIVESIGLNKLLDYKRYLLYTNQTKSQPALNFPVIPKPSTSVADEEVDNAVKDKQTDSNTGTEIISSNQVDEPVNKINSSISMNENKSSNNTSYAQSKITKTASDPKFLEEFYSNSRLHLISTLGAEFKQLVAQMREKSDEKFPGKEKLVAMRGKQIQIDRPPSSVIMHIDMDCFFVSVGLRNHPELRGKPVAITHAKSGVLTSNDPKRQASRQKEFELYHDRLPEGAPSRVVDIKDSIDSLASMSEIASCSYEARKYGIRNGMFLGQAVKLCPDLKTLPYDFEGYKEVSNTLYKTVASYTLDIEAVSCDEMYVDVKKVLIDTGLTVDGWASHIRNEIMTITGCPCSTGFGANRLQARLATKKAKPSGQYYLKPDDVENYMFEIPVSDLPGVGRATLTKLQNLGLNTCGDVQIASLKTLQSELGSKVGEKIRDQSFGRDNKPLDFNHERKSVSAEVNYGIRFKAIEECYNFLQSLSSEVYNRLSDINMKARGLTLKLLIRAEGAPVETAKFLGHGVCDAVTKSSSSNIIYNNADIIYKEAKSIYEKLNIPFADLRGVGIQLTKLEKTAPINKALSNFLKQGSSTKMTLDTSNKITDHKCDDTTVDSTISIYPKEQKSGSGNIQASATGSLKNPSLCTTPIVDAPKTNEHSSANVANTKRCLESNSAKTKGRGRPKGIKKSVLKNNVHKVTTKKDHTTMENFLGKNKMDSGGRRNDEHLEDIELTRLREQIDINVLNELPEDIRNEIMKEYQFKTAKSSNESTKLDTDKKVEIKSLAERERTETPSQAPRTSPFSNLSWDEIKPVVKSWIKSEKEPSEYDVQMLADHLRQLALDRKIDFLQSAFNFLHRIFSDLNCAWHQAYFSLVNAVQLGMVARYGKTLLVENDFSCCQIG